jgi:endoglucanase
MHCNGQTGISDNFNDNFLAPSWRGNAKFELYEINKRLKIGVQNASAKDRFSFVVTPMDISQHPVVTLKVKSSIDFSLLIELEDVSGNLTNSKPLVKKIEGDNITKEVNFDFTDRFEQITPTYAKVDQKKIKAVHFYFLPSEGSEFLGIVYFDDFKIGTGGSENGDPSPYPLTPNIRINQLGFYPNTQKIVAVVEPPQQSNKFFIKKIDDFSTVYEGTLSTPVVWEYSNENISIGDFSEFNVPGEYIVYVEGLGRSYNFEIKKNVFLPLSKGTIKMFYYQRSGIELEEKYAGTWHRPLGHPDVRVKIHKTAASKNRPEGTYIASPKGWYDAGDYGKYIVNSGISTYTLMSLYENFSVFFDTLNLNIPESSNSLPDILDEVLWNLRWMFTMQEPNEGFLYHKLTAHNFEGKVMPHQHTDERLVVGKGTAAALDFAAVMAQAARLFKKFNNLLPGFSDSCLNASLKAWRWAKANPNVPFKNPIDVVTGEYGDNNFSDEFHWAAAELYITTKQDSFIVQFPILNAYSLPSWPNVAALGLFSLVQNRKNLTAKIDTNSIKNKLLRLADIYKKEALKNSAYKVPIGATFDFVWGSNANAANQGMLLLHAYKITNNIEYFNAALSALDYLLGRNATRYSFVTGFGKFSPMNPHHRPSAADNVTDPIPGMLVGGPQNENNPESGCAYDSDLPAVKYKDNWCSYSTNEIAINWNAPLAFLVGAIEYYANFK